MCRMSMCVGCILRRILVLDDLWVGWRVVVGNEVGLAPWCCLFCGEGHFAFPFLVELVSDPAGVGLFA